MIHRFLRFQNVNVLQSVFHLCWDWSESSAKSLDRTVQGFPKGPFRFPASDPISRRMYQHALNFWKMFWGALWHVFKGFVEGSREVLGMFGCSSWAMFEHNFVLAWDSPFVCGVLVQTHTKARTLNASSVFCTNVQEPCEGSLFSICAPWGGRWLIIHYQPLICHCHSKHLLVCTMVEDSTKDNWQQRWQTGTAEETAQTKQNTELVGHIHISFYALGLSWILWDCSRPLFSRSWGTPLAAFGSLLVPYPKGGSVTW